VSSASQAKIDRVKINRTNPGNPFLRIALSGITRANPSCHGAGHPKPGEVSTRHDCRITLQHFLGKIPDLLPTAVFLIGWLSDRMY
jgi:hypothetical protein